MARSDSARSAAFFTSFSVLVRVAPVSMSLIVWRALDSTGSADFSLSDNDAFPSQQAAGNEAETEANKKSHQYDGPTSP